MTTVIKTQCPHCQASFKLPRAQLNRADTKGRCNRCQHIFLVNEHLLVSAENQALTPNKITYANKQAHDVEYEENEKKIFLNKKSAINSNAQPSTSSKEKDVNLDANILIHDDMEIDEPPEALTEYDSLDEMDAWLTQVDASPSNNYNTTESTSSDNNADSLADANTTHLQPIIPTVTSLRSNANANRSNTPNANNHQRTAEKSISSAIANDIHARVAASDGSDINENAWLETLLKEQNGLDSSAVNEQDDTDLSQLLTDLGVSPDEEENTNQARDNNIKARVQLSPTSTQNSIATGLWAAGCLVLALLLMAQYVIFNLDNLVKNPTVAARLQTICSSAACSLPHADITALNIKKLAYRPSKVKSAATFSDVQADLINESPQSQLLPNLKVSIYGSNAIIGEFIAQPADYLLSTENQLAAERSKSVMFTIPVATNQISDVQIIPIY